MRTSAPGHRRRWPWSIGPWLATAHLLVAFPLTLLTVGVLLALGVLTGGLAVPAVTRLATRVHRSRFAAFLGVMIEPHPDRSRLVDAGERRRSPYRRLRHLLHPSRLLRPSQLLHPSRLLRPSRLRRSPQLPHQPRLRRRLAYLVLSGPVCGLLALVTLCGWSAGIVLATVGLHGRLLPEEAIFGVNPHAPITAGILTAIGLIVLFLAARLAVAAARLDTAMARALLEPTTREQLVQQVTSLTTSRADLVAAVDAERRRIERDLHDGAQQRLVSLAMNLGISRAMANDLPEPAREAIARAHDEAKLALSELRGFVRNLHPAVLEDLGLDAALSGIAARCPVPVRLRVDLPGRLPRQVEAVAYFVVSEALTNVARHATATSVTVRVRHIAVDATDDAMTDGTMTNGSMTGSVVTDDAMTGGTTTGGRATGDTTTGTTTGGTTTGGTIAGDAMTGGTIAGDTMAGGTVTGGFIQISVEDDGRGGARVEGGTGLIGLAQRVGSIDGSLLIDSPVGGPTRIVVRLPVEASCAS